jgi:predicted HTH domain antitoxin
MLIDIEIEDFEKLLKDRGEACIAMENKLRESVNINRLKPVTD